MIKGKSFLVTGGSGSFGKAFVRRILQDEPRRVVIYSRGEHLQERMQQELNGNPALRFYIGDVRDYRRLEMAMEGIDVCVHAAAMKVVPKCEVDPIEAVATNILGSQNVIQACLRHNVHKVIALSSDKAVAPINLYGATKLAAEKLLMAAHNIRGSRRTLFSVCRYGNVWGSAGSVVPLFQRLAAEGKPFPITDRHMTRFIITMEHAIRFVLDALEAMQGSEIFIPKIPSARVVDIAEAIDPNREVVFTSIRPGEKLHEVLLTTDESRLVDDTDCGLYVLRPHGVPVSNVVSWSYASNTNMSWLSVEELRAML